MSGFLEICFLSARCLSFISSFGNFTRNISSNLLFSLFSSFHSLSLYGASPFHSLSICLPLSPLSLLSPSLLQSFSLSFSLSISLAYLMDVCLSFLTLPPCFWKNPGVDFTTKKIREMSLLLLLLLTRLTTFYVYNLFLNLQCLNEIIVFWYNIFLYLKSLDKLLFITIVYCLVFISKNKLIKK